MEPIEIECISLGQEAYAKVLLNCDSWQFEVWETPLHGGPYSLSMSFDNHGDAMEYANSLS